MEKSAVYGGQRQPEPPAPEHVAGGEEKEEWEGGWDKVKATSDGMKALQWILLVILFGVKVQTVEDLEEEIPAHQEMESGLLTGLFLRDGQL